MNVDVSDSDQDRMMDKRFYERVCLAVLTNAIEEAKRVAGLSAREWLMSEYAGRIAEGAGLEAAYFRRIVVKAWEEPANSRRQYKKRIKRTKEEREASLADQKAQKQAKARAKGYKLTRKQMIFVDAFRASGDTNKARFVAGVGGPTVKAWLRNEHITSLMYADKLPETA